MHTTHQSNGFNDVIYLDAVHNKYVEEVSSCNIFAVFKERGGVRIVTPTLRGTILPGVTRKSVIELGRMRGYSVEEADLSIDELLQADEVFTTGTAVVISPVGHIACGGKKRDYKGGQGDVAKEMYKALTDIQLARTEDPFGWVVDVI